MHQPIRRIQKWILQILKNTKRNRKNTKNKEYEKQDDGSEDDKNCSLYKLPPYPPITEEQLLEEKYFCENTLSKTLENNYQLNLKNLNNYSCNCRNDFKLM